ncbi:MAG: hypothetical protein QGD90_01070 [Candidatus Hydrogenedentes bacterium]|nr:hypothetical protein [Candidatus Hydrogenedentota bacterium]
MASKSNGRVIAGCLAMPKAEHARMLRNINCDPTLEFVAKHGRRATWLRAAIAEKCEKQEREKAGK